MSSTELNAVIPGSLRVPGTIMLVVVNLLPSGNITSNSVPITVTGGAPATAPDLSVAIMSMGNFTAGTNGVLTITITNVGNGPTTGNITTTDNLPNGLTFVSANGNGSNCSANGQLVTCINAGPIAPNGVITITKTVAVGAAAVPSVTDSASATTPGDGNTGTKSASVTVMVSAMGPAPAGVIGMISPPSPGTPGNGDSDSPAPDGDPFVAFVSQANNLVPNDTNGNSDVFVACVVGGPATTCTSPITRVSVATGGGELNAGGTGPPSITADGRFVAFISSDPNVVPPGVNAPMGTQIYVRDTCTGQPASCTPSTFLASQSTGGVAATQNSMSPAISSGGRVVAFNSGDFTLAPPASGFQIYARDTCFGVSAACLPRTVLVSADNNGLNGIGFSDRPSVSADGRFVAFQSNANTLVPNPTFVMQDIFLRDTCIGAPAGCMPTTTRVSATPTGAPGNNFSNDPSISGDGRFVVFTSQASDIVPGGNTAALRPDVFLRDTCGGTNGPVVGCTPSTTRVSVALDGTQANGLSIAARSGSSISTNGRFVAFGSGATNLLPTPSSPMQVYVLDNCFGAPAGCTPALHKVTVDSMGIEVGTSGQFSISGDGRFLAFTNLVGTAPNQVQQIFLAFTGF